MHPKKVVKGLDGLYVQDEDTHCWYKLDNTCIPDIEIDENTVYVQYKSIGKDTDSAEFTIETLTRGNKKMRKLKKQMQKQLSKANRLFHKYQKEWIKELTSTHNGTKKESE